MKAGLNWWFYSWAGAWYLPNRPEFFHSPAGFVLGGIKIRTLLLSGNEFDMQTTNADAVLARFIFFPGKTRLKKLFANLKKPVILSVPFWIVAGINIVSFTRDMEDNGVVAWHIDKMIPPSVTKEICLASTVPVIISSGSARKELTAKIKAGASILRIKGKHISKELLSFLRQDFPHVTVLAFCGKSEKLMSRCVELGVDAVVYKPFMSPDNIGGVS